MTTIGEMSLWVALMMAAWAAAASVIGSLRGVPPLRESGERGIHAVLALLMVASAALGSAMLAHDFSVAHVARFTSANMPRVYLITAFWAGREASWLLAVLILAAFSFLAVVRNARAAHGSPVFTGIVGTILTLALVVSSIALNPFERLSWTPLEGQGLHPQLQSPGMALHPPMLYAGYIATAIPFAIVLSAIVTRGLSQDAFASTRRWMLGAWLLNTIGIFLGLWWAYHEPALGTRWLRYPVENASLLPWTVSSAFLLATAFQERRGSIRRWSLSLVIAAFLLSAGALVLSIERIVYISTGSASTPSIWIAGVTALSIAAGGYLVNSRVPDVPVTSTTQRAGATWRIGLALIGVAIVAISVGLAGTSLSRPSDVILQPAQSVTVTDGFDTRWTVASQGTSQYDILNRRVTAIALDLGHEESRRLLVSGELRQYLDSRRARIFEPSREPGIRGGWLQDVYVVLNEVSEDGAASVTVSFYPFLRWLWVGGALLAAGGLLAFVPRGSNV